MRIAEMTGMLNVYTEERLKIMTEKKNNQLQNEAEM